MAGTFSIQDHLLTVVTGDREGGNVLVRVERSLYTKFPDTADDFAWDFTDGLAEFSRARRARLPV